MSVAVIGVEKAITLWNSPGWSGGLPTPIEATEPAGACVGAIVQPFYLANPEDPGSGVVAMSGAGTHWSTAILGGLTDSGGPSLDLLVGYSQVGGDPSGQALTGLPVFRLPFSNGGLVTDAPYKGPAAYGAADLRSVKGPATLTRGAVRLAVVPGINVTRNTGTYATNLALGIAAGAPNGLPSSNKLVIVDEKDPANPALTAEWPKESPFGQGVPFELLRRTPLVDPVWKLVAIPMARTLPGGATDMAHVTWCVLDLSHPETPTTVAILPDQGPWGALYDRQLYLSQSGGGAVVVDLRQAIGTAAEKVEGVRPRQANGLREMAAATTTVSNGCTARFDFQIQEIRPQVNALAKGNAFEPANNVPRLILRSRNDSAGKPIGTRPFFHPGGTDRLVTVLSIPKGGPSGQLAHNVDAHQHYPRYVFLKVLRPPDILPSTLKAHVRLKSSRLWGGWNLSGSNWWDQPAGMAAGGYALGTNMGDPLANPRNFNKFNNVGGLAGDDFIYVGPAGPPTSYGIPEWYQLLITRTDKDSEVRWDERADGDPPSYLGNLEVMLTGRAISGQTVRSFMASNSQDKMQLILHWPLPQNAWAVPGAGGDRYPTDHNFWATLTTWRWFRGLTAANKPTWLRPLSEVSLEHGGGHSAQHFSGNEIDTQHFVDSRPYEAETNQTLGTGGIIYNDLVQKLIKANNAADPVAQQSARNALAQWVQNTRAQMEACNNTPYNPDNPKGPVRVIFIQYLQEGSPVFDILLKGRVNDTYHFNDGAGNRSLRLNVDLTSNPTNISLWGAGIDYINKYHWWALDKKTVSQRPLGQGITARPSLPVLTPGIAGAFAGETVMMEVGTTSGIDLGDPQVLVQFSGKPGTGVPVTGALLPSGPGDTPQRRRFTVPTEAYSGLVRVVRQVGTTTTVLAVSAQAFGVFIPGRGSAVVHHNHVHIRLRDDNPGNSFGNGQFY